MSETASTKPQWVTVDADGDIMFWVNKPAADKWVSDNGGSIEPIPDEVVDFDPDDPETAFEELEKVLNEFGLTAGPDADAEAMLPLAKPLADFWREHGITGIRFAREEE